MTKNHSSLFRTLVVCAIVSTSLLCGKQAFAQPQQLSFDAANGSSNPLVSTSQSVVEQLIFQGSKLEAKGEWAAALTHYEGAIKDYPQDAHLHKRLLNARIHYDLHRRYLDASYIKTIRNGDQRTALETFAEVLLKIQSYYVQEPDWLAFARRGLSNLDIALFDPAFQEVHLTSVSYDKLHQAQIAMHQSLDSKTIRSRQELYNFAAQASQILRREVNLPEPAVIYEFVSGAVGSLDPYSAYLTADQYNEVMNHIEGNFVGLGVEIRPTETTLEIIDVIKGGPASQGGLKPGDLITAIDGKRVADIGGDPAADLLRGLEGSLVVLNVDVKGGKSVQMSLRRRLVDIPSVEEARIIDSQNGVGYIKLVNFEKTTLRDFDAALWKLHREGMRSLIVDLRGNPGGLLTASVDIADRFVPSGVIVSTRGRNPQEDYVHRARQQGTWGVPLTVLIDGNSASASEILAGAIHDHHRGTIVGERSYGKGSVQGIFPLNLSSGGVRLTTAKFYSPLGTAISDRGVSPDVVVNVTRRVSPDNPNAQIEPADEVLLAGLRVARDKVQARQQ